MAAYHEFDKGEVQAIIDAGANHHKTLNLQSSPADAMLHTSATLGETCVSVTVDDHTTRQR